MQLNQDNVQVTFKSCATFTNCIPDTLNTRVDETKNRRKLRRGSIRIKDISFGIGLEIFCKFFLRKLFCKKY